MLIEEDQHLKNGFLKIGINMKQIGKALIEIMIDTIVEQISKRTIKQIHTCTFTFSIIKTLSTGN